MLRVSDQVFNTLTNLGRPAIWKNSSPIFRTQDQVLDYISAHAIRGLTIPVSGQFIEFETQGGKQKIRANRNNAKYVDA